MVSPAWLVSSAGRRGELVKILKSVPLSGSVSRVAAVDCSPLSAAGLIADDFGIVPLAREDDFIPSVVRWAKEFGAKTVIPTIDPELNVYAEHREQLGALGLDVWVSAPSVTELGFDKWRFSRWCQDSGIPTSMTLQAGDPAIRNLAGEVVAKPRFGSASMGVLHFSDADQASRANLSGDYILQEKAAGDEITVDFAVSKHGALLGYSARKRLEVRAGEVSKAVTIDHPLVTETLIEAVKALDGAFGVLNLQLFLDEEGDTISALELNPRFGGGYPLSHYAGCDLIGAMLASLDSQEGDLVTAQPGVVMLRYDAQVLSTLEELAEVRL